MLFVIIMQVRHKHMKMAKNVDGFQPLFGLNNDYRGAPPPPPLGISLAVKPEIVGVAGANMQWGQPFSICTRILT